jgi:hypothetical protein
VSFTATVTPSTATGTVTFFDGSTALITDLPVSGGQATFSVPNLSAGTHSITATYNGDANYGGSTSGVLVQTVNAVAKTSTTTTLASSSNPAIAGQTLIFTATVSPSTATGSVAFNAGGVPIICLEVGTVVNGQAKCTAALGLIAGTFSITAVYSGDSNNGSSSGSLTQIVNAH